MTNQAVNHPGTGWALITGASMGLGEEFARQLAARGVNLLLTARSGELLDKLASDLRSAHGVRIEVQVADLSEAGASQQLVNWLKELQLTPNWLINNAGFGHARPIAELPAQRISDCIRVNVLALTELTRLLLPQLMALSEARVINVASTAAFQPVPYFGVYAATKAYVLSFSEALREELRDTGVWVTCLCPGPTSTSFGKNNEIKPRMFHFKQTAPEVVRLGLDASDRNRAVVVTQNRWQLLLQRVLPRVVIRKIAAWLLRKSLGL